MIRTILCFAAAVSLLGVLRPVVAQPATGERLGFLSGASASSMTARIEAFRQGLRELGYREGQNLDIVYRWGQGKNERLDALASELVRLKVRILITHGVEATLAARKASVAIPIVCLSCGDLEATGVVASLAHPGGNITGLTIIAPEMSGKRLELLKEVIPNLARVAVLYNPANPVSVPELKETEAAARSMGLQTRVYGVADPNRFEPAHAAMKQDRADALIVLSDAMFFGRQKQIAALAIANRLPAVSYNRAFAKAGGLIGYGPDLSALARRAANYVDKILKGAKPSEIPVERPAKFELVVNAKTAAAIGVAIPRSILARADEVIE